MKKTIIIFALISILSACGESNKDNSVDIMSSDYENRKKEEAKKKLEAKKEQEKLEAERLEAERLEAERLEAERLEAERIANLDPYKNYEEFKLKDLEDGDLKDLINKNISEYESIIEKIKSDFNQHVEQIKIPRNENISELNKEIKRLDNQYELMCKDLTEEILEQCKIISTHKVDIELKIEVINNSLKKSIEKLEIEKKQKMDKFNSDMKRNIKHLLNQKH